MHYKLAKSRLTQRGLLVAVALVFTSLCFAQTAIRSDFDHDSTGFPLDGAHLIANCGTCHAAGVFTGTPRQCADCHEDGSTIIATTKPALHIVATQQCDACHATRSFIPLSRMDHNETIGDCVSCHNNTIARGKTIDHPPTPDTCDNCHLTVAFSPQFIGAGVSLQDIANYFDNGVERLPATAARTPSCTTDCERPNAWSAQRGLTGGERR